MPWTKRRAVHPEAVRPWPLVVASAGHGYQQERSGQKSQELPEPAHQLVQRPFDQRGSTAGLSSSALTSTLP